MNSYTVTPRYNAVVGRHLLEPPYKRGAICDPVDLFDIIIPRQRTRYPTNIPGQVAKALKLKLSCVTINHSFRNIQSPCSRGLMYIANREETNKWTKPR